MPKLDATAVFSGQQNYTDALRHVSYNDLIEDTEEIYNELASILETIDDAVVTFVPRDAKSQEDGELGWTLGRVIAHLTATFEGAAATAAMMARGVVVEQSLRYEVPWETMRSAEQVHERLQESHKMCRALLEAWPREPHLDIMIIPIPQLGPMNAIGRHVLAIFHAQSHLAQLREIIHQAAS